MQDTIVAISITDADTLRGSSTFRIFEYITLTTLFAKGNIARGNVANIQRILFAWAKENIIAAIISVITTHSTAI